MSILIFNSLWFLKFIFTFQKCKKINFKSATRLSTLSWSRNQQLGTRFITIQLEATNQTWKQQKIWQEREQANRKKKSAPRVHVRMRIDANYELDLCMHNILLPILDAAFPLKVFIRLLFCSRWRSTLSAKWLKCHTHMSINCQLTLSLGKICWKCFFFNFFLKQIYLIFM